MTGYFVIIVHADHLKHTSFPLRLVSFHSSSFTQTISLKALSRVRSHNFQYCHLHSTSSLSPSLHCNALVLSPSPPLQSLSAVHQLDSTALAPPPLNLFISQNSKWRSSSKFEYLVVFINLTQVVDEAGQDNSLPLLNLNRLPVDHNLGTNLLQGVAFLHLGQQQLGLTFLQLTPSKENRVKAAPSNRITPTSQAVHSVQWPHERRSGDF